MFEVLLKSLHGIEIVFAQGKGAGCGGGPGIHQCHLHHVVLLPGVADERPPVAHVDMHIGPLIQVKRIVGVTATHDGVGDDGIDLDSGDAVTAVGHGAKHVHAASRPDDGVISVRPQHIG